MENNQHQDGREKKFLLTKTPVLYIEHSTTIVNIN